MPGEVQIGAASWHIASTKVIEKREQQPRQRFLRHFTYDLQARCVSTSREAEAQSLFFEHVLGGRIEGIGKNNDEDEYILLELCDASVEEEGVKGRFVFQYQTDPLREKILRNGVGVDRKLYSLMGCSNSGVQSHSFVFRRGTLAENEALLLKLMPKLRELEQKKGAPKRVKYQGLLFSGVTVVQMPRDAGGTSVEELPAVESADNKFDFTDGAGVISLKLARALWTRLGRGGRRLSSQGGLPPSVWQIRYAGAVRLLDGMVRWHICKGVLVVDPRDDMSCRIQLRKSMLKEEVSKEVAESLGDKIGVIEWSRKSLGHLSQQLLCLLTASVPDDTLEEMQRTQLEAVESAARNPLGAAWLAAMEVNGSAWQGWQDMVFQMADKQRYEALVSANLDEEEKGAPTSDKEADREEENKENKGTKKGKDKLGGKEKEKCLEEKKGSSVTKLQHSSKVMRIPGAYLKCVQGRGHPRHLSESTKKVKVPLACCRTLYGVAFPELGLHNLIGEHECLVLLEDGPLEEGTVVVTRSPSYHPGDVRVLTNLAGRLPAGHPAGRLRNCIFFSTQGARPEPDKMGGGDLDGDKFLVTWDPRLLQYAEDLRRHEPADYGPPAPAPNNCMGTSEEQTRTDWIHYAALTDNAMLGVVESTYYAVCKQFGVVSEQNRTLNTLFSQLVDRNPSALDKLQELSKLAYNPQACSTAVVLPRSGDHEVVWERMLRRQLKAAKNMRSEGLKVKNEEAYVNFLSGLEDLCADSKKMWSQFRAIEFHMHGAFQKRRVADTLARLERLFHTPEKVGHSEIPKQLAFRQHLVLEEDLDKNLRSRLAELARASIAAFDEPMAKVDTYRQDCIRRIERQRALREKALSKYAEQDVELQEQVQQATADFEERRRKLEEAHSDSVKDIKDQLAQLQEASRTQREDELSSRADVEAQLKKVRNSLAVKQQEISANHWSWTPSMMSGDKARRLCEIDSLRKAESKAVRALEQIDCNIENLEHHLRDRSEALSQLKATRRVKTDWHINSCEKQLDQELAQVQQKIEQNKALGFRHESGRRHEELQASLEEAKFNLQESSKEEQQARSEHSQCKRKLGGLRKEQDQSKVKVQEIEAMQQSLSCFADIAHQTALQRGLMLDASDPDEASLTTHYGVFCNQRLPLLCGGVLTQLTKTGDPIRRLAHQLCDAGLGAVAASDIVQAYAGEQDSALVERLASNQHALIKFSKALQQKGDELLSHRSKLEEQKQCLSCPTCDLEARLSTLQTSELDIRTTSNKKRKKSKAKKKVADLQKKLRKFQEQEDCFDDRLEATHLAQASLAQCSQDIQAELNKSHGPTSFAQCLTPSDVLVLVAEAKKLQLPIAGQIIVPSAIKGDLDQCRRCYRVFVDVLQKLVPKAKDRAVTSLEELSAKLHLLDNEEIPAMMKQLDSAEARVEETTAHTKTLEEEVDKLVQKADKTFWPEELEKAEAALLDSEMHEASLQLGIAHIRRKFKAVCGELASFKPDSLNRRTDNFGNETAEKARLEQRLQRVCLMEENRARGVSRPKQKCEPLPVYAKRAELNHLMASSDCVIVTAGTGCGKSTQIPQYIVDDAPTWWAPTKSADSAQERGFRICCTQPRRLATTSIAERVASEFKTELGHNVGFQVGKRDGDRPEDRRCISDETQIEFVTEGLLLVQLKTSPHRIQNYDVVIIDEAHERNKETDLLLAHLRNHLRRLRDEPRAGDVPLKVVVMSASIDWRRFCSYFDGCPHMDCPGRVFPVEEIYRPLLPNAAREGEGAGDRDRLVEHAVQVLFEDIVAARHEEGDVLIFFSGSGPIERCVDAINKEAAERDENVVAYPLYSALDHTSKHAAKSKNHRCGLDTKRRWPGLRGSPFIRKVICCTNIAETSLTIDGVRFVLDSGKVKKLRYDHLLRAPALQEEWVAQASTKQRKGRAGRTQSGWCFYLYDKETHREEMPEYDTPSILDMPAEKLILYSLKTCGGPVSDLGLLDPPEEDNVMAATNRLVDLGFLEQGGGSFTSDGDLAATLDRLLPEAVRMILRCNTDTPEHLARAMKMAALVSAEDEIIIQQRKNNNELKGNHVEKADEQYAKEKPHREHSLGDHFAALACFELFERKKASCSRTHSGAKGPDKGVKRASKNDEKHLRRWCKDQGLNFAVLNQVQLAVEGCHKELKNRKMLRDLSGVEKKQWTSDESILRAMISGFFHQLVEALDPCLISDRAEFRLLVPDDSTPELAKLLIPELSRGSETTIVQLDRDSCLWSVVKNANAPLFECLADEEEDQEDCGKLEVNITKPKTDCRSNVLGYLLFSRLFSLKIKGFQKKLVLMQGATIIDPHWVSEQVPAHWIERIKFDPEKSTWCCDAVRNIGPKIIGNLCGRTNDSFLNRIGEEYGIHTAVFRERCQVRIYGPQERVGRAKTAILSYVEDYIAAAEGASHGSVIVRGIGTIGSGLVLERPGQSENLHRRFIGHPKPSLTPADITAARASFRLKKHNHDLQLFVNCGWSSVLSPALNDALQQFNHRFAKGPGSATAVQCGKLTPKQSRVDLSISHENFPAAPSRNNDHSGRGSGMGKGGRGKGKKGKRRKGIGNARIDAAALSALERHLRSSLPSVNLLPYHPDCGDFTKFLALARECHQESNFWKAEFLPQLRSLHIPTKIGVLFAPSRGAFEVCGVLPDALIRCMGDIGKGKSFSINGSGSPLRRSEIFRFTSIVEELRKRHPSALFAVDGISSFHSEGEVTIEVQEVKDCAMEQAPDTMQHIMKKDCCYSGQWEASLCNGVGDPQLWLQMDHQRLSEAVQSQGPVMSLYVHVLAIRNDVLVRAAADCKERLRSWNNFLGSSSLPGKLVSESNKGRGVDVSICVMCRRRVTVPFYKKKGYGNGAVQSDELRGFRLTHCGCVFCRECFRATATLSAAAIQKVACPHCSRLVLARDDCQSIMTPDFKIMQNDSSQTVLLDTYLREWTALVRPTETRYCLDHITEISDTRLEGPVQCPDCGASVLYRQDARFFCCTTQNCPNKFCARCHKVLHRLEMYELCATAQCSMEDLTGGDDSTHMLLPSVLETDSN